MLARRDFPLVMPNCQPKLLSLGQVGKCIVGSKKAWWPRGWGARAGKLATAVALAFAMGGGTPVQQAQAADTPCGAVSCCHKIDDYFQLKKQEIKFGDTPFYKIPAKATCDSPLGEFLSGMRFLEHLTDKFPEETRFVREASSAIADFTVYFGTLPDSYAHTSDGFMSMIFSMENRTESTVKMAATIAHELVHARWGASHVECLRGPSKGTRNCDDRLMKEFDPGQPWSYTANFVVIELARQVLPKSEKNEHWWINVQLDGLKYQHINYPPNWLK